MDKQVLIDINDPRSGKIVEALANPTCKKILNLIAENEMSATELANKLNVPLNTVTYNLDKLIDSGLIEKTGSVLWSVKGKQVPKYKISNKKVVISPKSMVRGIVPAILGTAIVTLGIKLFQNSIGGASVVVDEINAPQILSSDSGIGVASTEIASKAADFVGKIVPPRPIPEPIVQACADPQIWAWFLLGSLFAILIFLLWNLKGGHK